MKVLTYISPFLTEVRDVAIPCPNKGQVLIDIDYCGVCGSDIGIFSGKHPCAEAPLILGHEFVSRIKEVNSCKYGWEFGQRVAAYPLLSCGKCYACRTGSPHICESLRLLGIDTDGGFAEYICVDEDLLVSLPDGVSDPIAALIEPMAVVLHALHRSGFRYLDKVAVLGAGPIGLLTAIVLRKAGASEIIVSEKNEQRAKISADMGFNTVWIENESLYSEVMKKALGDGVDVAFECSGNEATTFESMSLARVGGTICMTGQHKIPPKCDLPTFSFKEQRLIASRVYRKEDFIRTAHYIGGLQAELEHVITHIVPLKKANTVYDLIADQKQASMKVLVRCKGDV